MVEQIYLDKERLENLSTLMQFPGEGIFSKVLIKSESFSCALLCLAQGNEIYMHSSSGKACIQLLEGSALLRLVDRDLKMIRGDFLYLPEHLPHSIRAAENLAFLLCLSHMITRELYDLKRKAA